MAMAASSPAMAHSVFKQGVIIIGAGVIGLSLFLGMQLLIRSDTILEKPDSQRTFLDFVRVDANEEVQTKKRQPPEPPPPETPPETPEMQRQVADFNPNLDMSMPSIGSSINTGAGPFLGEGGGMAGFDTDVIPIVRVAPSYPRAAMQARLQGYVTLEVLINPDGTVSNAQVIESDPRGIFDRAAIDAMRNWKFRPKVVGGTPVAQRGRQTIEFKLGGK